MTFLVWLLSLLAGITAVAIGAGQAAARGQRPWVPLAVTWLGLAVSLHLVQLDSLSHFASTALTLLAPLAVAALVSETEVQRGCSVWRAGGLAVPLGLIVAAAALFLLPVLTRLAAHLATATGL